MLTVGRHSIPLLHMNYILKHAHSGNRVESLTALTPPSCAIFANWRSVYLLTTLGGGVRGGSLNYYHNYSGINLVISTR